MLRKQIKRELLFNKIVTKLRADARDYWQTFRRQIKGEASRAQATSVEERIVFVLRL